MLKKIKRLEGVKKLKTSDLKKVTGGCVTYDLAFVCYEDGNCWDSNIDLSGDYIMCVPTVPIF